MKPLLVTAAVTTGILTLGACAVPHSTIGTPPPSSPPVTSTAPAPPPPTPTKAPNNDDGFSDDVADAALSMTWDGMDAEQRALLCNLVDTNEQYAWQSFSKGANGKFTKAQFLAFFKRVC